MDGFHIRGIVDGYDVEGEGKTLRDALTTYAVDCRKAAANYTAMAARLFKQAELAETMVDMTEDPEE